MNGTVKHWNVERAYGFITPEDGSKDIFVHVSGIRGGIKELVPGDQVTFDLAPTPKGRAAVNLRITAR